MVQNRSSVLSSQSRPNPSPGGRWGWAVIVGMVGIGIAYAARNAAEWQVGRASVEAGWLSPSDEAIEADSTDGQRPQDKALRLAMSDYKPRMVTDTSGYGWVVGAVKPWPSNTSLSSIGSHFRSSILASIAQLDRLVADPKLPMDQRASTRFSRSTFLNFEGKPEDAYEDLRLARQWVETQPQVAKDFLYTLIYAQGVTAMRRGENENCILCRGESSCILPISKAAVHIHPEGSRLAIQHFSEYLDRFPNDGEVRWLLNVAHMTLDEHPQSVAPSRLVDIGVYAHQEHGIGRFRDIGERVGLNRFNQAGGAIMEDFDNDGLLDIIVSSFDPTQMMGVYSNDGRGNFIDRTDDAGVANQLGGLNCVQTDYNNDGWMDVLIVRGAWLPSNLAMRPTLLRNNGDRTFSDVTDEAGIGEPLNSISASWADYDNDGWLDLFVCCEQQSNRLYRNLQNGTFEEVAAKAGVAGGVGFVCKGANWLDYDNDGWPDLFLNHLSTAGAKLYRNRRDGTFENVSQRMGIQGPILGFSCWAWDFNNDGWQDIFATNYSRSVDACVKGMLGEPHSEPKSCLYLNLEGNGFRDVASEVGLDGVYITMGSNFADFDNDGWLDMYLGTGDPSLGTLVPNRLFRSIQGKRFVDISASSGTGNLQKGHGVACGDWDRNGCLDLFIEMGGAVNGDKYHNILFQNPGNDRAWIRLKLIGKQSNRAAIGARIRIETDGTGPTIVHRHISSGSSFGANPLEQVIGLGDATRITSLEITWPTSRTVQTFRDVAVRQSIEITESEKMYQTLKTSPIALSLDP